MDVLRPDERRGEGAAVKKPNQFEYQGDARFDFFYPDITGNAKPVYLTVGLLHVRAADDIRIHYDGVRDGWVIEQSGRFEWSDDDPPEEQNPDWQEVAFVQAWARDKRKEST